MNKISLEIISDRPLNINLNSLRAQGALMMAHMGGYIDKKSIEHDKAASTIKVTIREKALQLIEEQLK